MTRFYNDHATAALIWNYKTREELKEALDAELRAFNVDKELGGKHDISWNHTEFEVRRGDWNWNGDGGGDGDWDWNWD